MLDDAQAKRNVAANIALLLERNRWKQADLARAIQLPDEDLETVQVRVSRYLSGTRLASGAALARIAEALCTSVDFLLSPPKTAGSKISA